ncbi:MAG: Ppx/GppA family phosphatase [Proteobacteria bacterium]|nr:Ppx/GppA family phosphatase [Pseudomonadota bacterium]
MTNTRPTRGAGSRHWRRTVAKPSSQPSGDRAPGAGSGGAEGGEGQPRTRGPVYGALDLGTNNCRLLVARPSRRGLQVVDAFSRIIRLGEGVGRTGRLSDAAMSRTIDALKVCSAKLERAQVARARLVATEACRIAENGMEFLDRVREDVGLDIELLTPEAEARLAVAGCAALLDGRSDLTLVFDIGGGSSELIWLDLSRRRGGWRRSIADRMEAQGCIAAWTSLPVGVVTLAERFGGRHVTADDFEAMVGHVLEMLEPFEGRFGFRKRIEGRPSHLLGTSGTVTTVAGIHLGLKRYDRSRVDGCWMKTDDARKVTERLISCSYEERMAEPCIGRDRADLVLAGCAILEAILRLWPCPSLRVADRGLREGILASLMAEDGHYRPNRRQANGEAGE